MKRSHALASLVLGLCLSAPAFGCNTLDDAYLSKVDAAKKQLVVTKGETKQTFTAADKTVVTLNGKAATFADLKAGDKITVDYESETDVVAIKITRET